MSETRNTTESESYEQYCVLLRNTLADKLVVHADDKVDHRVLRLGLLIKIYYFEPTNDFIALFDASDNTNWVVKKTDVVPVLPALVQAFEAVVSYSARVDLATNASLCNELAKIKTGSKVYVCPDAEQNSGNWEVADVRYIGPIPELGSASHFYGLVLGPNSTLGEVDGTYCNRRYFRCPVGCRGTFVSIDRIRLYTDVHTHSAKVPCLQESSASMQANRNNNESAQTNYRTTLHLKLNLKDKKNIPNTNSFRVEDIKHMSKIPYLAADRSEKLIAIDTDEECLLHKGDRVVWMSDDTGAEVGTVRWIGRLNEYSDLKIGVEFDNPVGSGTGTHKGTCYFQTKMGHASFLSIHALMKADDFFCQPEGNTQQKSKSSKPVESWSRATVQLPDYQEKHSSTREQTAESSKPYCRSDYVFPEIFPNINTTKGKLDNASKRTLKDSKKPEINLDSYPIGEAPIRDYLQSDSIADNQRRRTTGEVLVPRHKPTEVKIRHAYSKDGSFHNSMDTTDLLGDNLLSTSADPKYTTKEKQKTATASQLNNNDPSALEIVGQSVQNVRKSNDHHEVIQLSPNLSDCSIGSDRLYDPVTEPLDLGVGSVVEVVCKGEPHYGVIRWIGYIPEDITNRPVAGIEMEEEQMGCSDGTFNNRRYFHCNPKKAFFVRLNQCKKDGRFQESMNNHADNRSKLFGPEDCPVIPGAIRPYTVSKQEDMDTVCGKFKGIQGHHNSCYLDATLFSMFAFTSAFDSLLFRPVGPNDADKYEEVQRVLREEIVNPLRKNQFCRWDRVMKLRTLLENHSSVTGLTSEEKDPEEFLTSLVAQMLKAKPFLKLSSGQEAYHYQLFVDKDEHLQSPTVQQLFEQSFLSSDIKLKEVPSCLIIQMPRFGKSYKMYPRIFPSPLLDVTDIIEDSPRQCTVCGKLAEFECRECFGKNGMESNTLESISFCTICRDAVHSHKLRSSHRFRQLTVPKEFSILQDHCQIPRLYMHLFAVVCIETSHYVSFVKCGSQPDSPWCFFDSMADRKGEQNGYNIPEVVSCPDVPYWLSEEGVKALSDFKDDRKLPEHAKRLLCDAYMCMYQSTDMIMYK